VRAYYTEQAALLGSQVRVSHILVKTRLAKSLSSSCGRSSKFEDLAVPTRPTPHRVARATSASSAGRMVAEFERAASRSRIRRHQRHREDPFGFHIIKLTSARKAPSAVRRVKDRIRVTL